MDKAKEELIKKLDREIQAIDEINKELMEENKRLELSIAKKELILQKLELEKLYELRVCQEKCVSCL